MENTLENKSKFISQYFGQKVYVNRHTTGLLKRIVSGFYLDRINHFESDFLELKPLSSISDEDAKELSYRLGQVIGLDNIIHENSTDLVKKVVENYTAIDCLWMLPARFTDKARELGYAIDWNEFSVEKQIEYNWIKLIN